MTGGSRAIAIVDAYHAPNARADLTFYSNQFGLPAITLSNFVIWYCGTMLASCNQTTPPAYNSGWEGEISLDVQMAHALAPSAIVYLVEANSNSYNDLLVAVDKATQLVAAQGGGQVSMSWGGPEFSGQTSYDSHFTGTPNVTYFASSGDDPSVSWPSSSPNIISVGGTSNARDPVSLGLLDQVTWTEAGVGPSVYYSRPSFQNVISGFIGNVRWTPDVAAIANPDTDVWVYISGQGGWFFFGGTSVASPVFAAIVNNAGTFSASSAAQLNLMYSNLGNTADFKDVRFGFCGPYAGYWSYSGWDECSGVGAPKTRAGK